MSTEISRDEQLAMFQDRIHYTFREVKLLAQALTHSSWANETGGKAPHNERLEFLGDAALELCVTQELFERFPSEREGEMTRMRARLVSQPSLSGLARRIGLDQCLLLGRGEESQGGRERASLLADAMEAVIGAVFLDGGFEQVRRVLRELFQESWPVAVERSKVKDYKSHLQELTQRHYKDRPSYALVSATGPEHAKVFEVLLTLPSGETLTAKGPSLKRAEQAAARAGIARVEQTDESTVARTEG